MAWNPFGKKNQTQPEVTPAQPIVTPEDKQQQAPPAAAAPAEPAQTEKKKSRRGKPQDRSRLTRNKVVQIRLTEEEATELKAAAKAQGMSMADFIMAGVQDTRQVVVPGGAQIRAELFRQGKNLNQAVMLCHRAIRENQRPDLATVTKAAVDVSAGVEQLMAWIEKWDAKITQVGLPKKEAKPDADNQV